MFFCVFFPHIAAHKSCFFYVHKDIHTHHYLTINPYYLTITSSLPHHYLTINPYYLTITSLLPHHYLTITSSV